MWAKAIRPRASSMRMPRMRCMGVMEVTFLLERISTPRPVPASLAKSDSDRHMPLAISAVALNLVKIHVIDASVIISHGVVMKTEVYPIACVEQFHLLFLDQLGRKQDKRHYAIKGGQSPLLSPEHPVF